MHLIYQLGIYLFGWMLQLAALFNPRAARLVQGRKGQLKKIKNEFAGKDNVVWVHCASLGEFEQGRPLIEEIRRHDSTLIILLTFYSPSGYEVRKNYSGVDYVAYLPLDTRRNARRFVKLVNPRKVFFVKYEYWYNYLSVLKKHEIPVYFVSAIFRKEQLFFKSHGKWYRKLLKLATHFFVQNETSAQLLEQIGIQNYTIAGDTRFDRVARLVESASPIELLEEFINGEKLIVVGSSWKAEEAMIRQFVRKNTSVKVVLAPHEVNDSNIERIMKLFEGIAVRYSQATSNNVSDKQVLVIDCYGMLNSLYQYAYLAIIGGGFGVGIHNTLEAACYGMPVIFGPNYERFREAVALVEKNCAFPVSNIEDFNTVLNHLLKSEDTTRKISENAAAYVKANIGASDKILKAVF
jgi:3-deoxy-D-manno-octulosonic-acid transferase